MITCEEVYKEIGWVTISGLAISNLHEIYMSSAILGDQDVFYGMPEITIENGSHTGNGCIYKIFALKDLGYDTIQSIIFNYNYIKDSVNGLISELDNINRFPITGTYGDDCIPFTVPFTLNESCIILYDDATSPKLNHHIIVLTDSSIVPEIVSISGSYSGPPVEIFHAFDAKYLDIFAKCNDGESIRLESGYTIEPNNKIINKIGSNEFKIVYYTYDTSVFVEGIKELIGIEGIYDGNPLCVGDKVQSKDFLISATYNDDKGNIISEYISDYSFPNGITIDEPINGFFNMQIEYKGWTAGIPIPIYTITEASITAFYNGPKVEIERKFIKEYCDIKICYKTDTGITLPVASIDPNECTFESEIITSEGSNVIAVRYNEATFGSLATSIIIPGIDPNKKLLNITANYSGAPLHQYQPIDTEYINCIANYSDGSSVVVKNYTYTPTRAEVVEDVIVTISFIDTGVEARCNIIIPCIPIYDTTENKYFPVKPSNNYPEASRYNNRYRGPVEGVKHNNISMMIHDNIHKINEIFKNIESDFNELLNEKDGYNDNKLSILYETVVLSGMENELLNTKLKLGG